MKRALLIGIGILLAPLAGLMLSLAAPVRSWRTGEPVSPPLATRPGMPLGRAPLRVWIDTDAACGHDRHTDPDDCFALLLLARAPDVQLAGVSTVFGNASIGVTDSTTRALVAHLAANGAAMPPVFRGASGPTPAAAAEPAALALRRALRDGPLVIVALGPLTNVAAALEAEPGLRRRIERLVAVMGRRRGHLFHPAEGEQAPSFLGHGPVFRDFNFAQDPAAAAAILADRLPLTLVPYEAARHTIIERADLDRMASDGGALAWTAARAREWLAYWREDIGKDGFYPFDLLAAAYTVTPQRFECATVSAWVGRDTGPLGWLGRTGLFVRPAKIAATVSGKAAAQQAPTLYCSGIDASLAPWLHQQGL